MLTISRRLGAPAFTDADLDMAFAFAGQASVAIEIVRAREDRRRLDTSRDRARIARDLHDHVIQRLFGAGLSLQAVSATVDADASAAIEAQVDAIDAAIKDIRTVVFALGAGERGRTKRTRDRLLDVVSEVSAGLSSTPRITFSGPLDSLVDAPLADDLVAVLRECLTNTIRHADADVVEIARRHHRWARHPHGRGRRPRHPRRCTSQRAGEPHRARPASRRDVHDHVRHRTRHTHRMVGSGGRRPGIGGLMIRVFLVDDHEIVRRGIAQLVDAEPDLTVIGEAGTFREAVRRIEATLPDVAVLDVRLPDGDGVTCAATSAPRIPEVACLILTAYDDDDALRSAVLAGASGYVLKDIRSGALINAIRRAAAGSTIQSADVLRRAATAMRPDTEDARGPAGPALSLRESQVLDLIASGMTNREIGARLGLAEKTVKNYVSGLLAKLGMERRTQAAVYGAERKHSSH